MSWKKDSGITLKKMARELLPGVWKLKDSYSINQIKIDSVRNGIKNYLLYSFINLKNTNKKVFLAHRKCYFQISIMVWDRITDRTEILMRIRN